MPTDTTAGQPAENGDTRHEDEAMPAASEDKVLEDTARMAREGRKELEADPKESKPAS